MIVQPTGAGFGALALAFPPAAGTPVVAKREWSNPHKIWMPYWQRFVRGIGLHDTTTYLHDGWRGSHGCVNLLGSDAKSLYRKLRIGTTVKVFGRRPGT
jgi:lipoprotein-anchoring transpeptidase ErfK/SrfK